MELEQKKDLLGKWKSTEAIGNTLLDWSALLKEGLAYLIIHFLQDESYEFSIIKDGIDITSTLKHSPPSKGHYKVRGNRIEIEGASNVQWSYEREDTKSLKIRIVGAKRFNRCRGVDSIFFQWVEEDSTLLKNQPDCLNAGTIPHGVKE